MGSRSVGTTTRTKKRALEKASTRKELDAMDTLEAQVVRMRHGIAEAPDSTEVGQPSESCDGETRARLQQIEEQVLARAATAGRRRNPVRDKIVRALKKKK